MSRLDLPVRPMGDVSPTRALASLDSQQAVLLAMLQSDDSAHRELLTSVMVSNTLMELTKLPWARLGIGEFAAATLNTLTQCASVEGCGFVFRSPGLPPIVCTLGDWPSEERFDSEMASRKGSPREMHTCSVFGKDPDVAIGYLGLSGISKSLLDAGLLERAADFLSSMMAMLIESEYLRRSAASSKVLELVSALDDDYEESDLVEIVSVLQTLPAAIGAKLTLAVPRFAGPIEVQAGLAPSTIAPTVLGESIDRTGNAELTIWWGDNGEKPSDSRFDEIAERFFGFAKRAEQTARLLSEVETDELTGIGNRRRASKALAQVSARSRRTGEEFALLLMDLDKFKSVNDKLGHEVGDKVLRSFSKAIEQAVRAYDIACRWGGEEFLLVCPTTGLAGAEVVATRLLRDTPVFCGEVVPEDWHQTVSIGIAVCQDPSIDSLELVRAADAAMYEAKNSGRNRYAVGSVKAKTKN